MTPGRHEDSATIAPALSASSEIRLAIVGCGAVAQKKLLPAVELSSRLRVTALVDVDEIRARNLAEEFGVSQVSKSIAEVKDADIAVVAVPHHVHAPVAIEAMKAGMNVFVEKPLATNMGEVRVMLEAAREMQKRICVGQVRRQYGSFKFVKALLEAGCLGQIHSFDFREGAVYGWPVETSATFDKSTAGGVLFDTGAHTLDMLLAWLGDFKTVRYYEDSRGGVEANCLLELELCSGATGTIELSRTRNLRNTCVIRGERGEIEIGVGPFGPVTLRIGGMESAADPRAVGQGELVPLDFTRIQIEEFADALTGGTDNDLFAENTVSLVRLFDACKVAPQVIDPSWEAFRAASSFPRLTGKRVLVVGGTGFIGSRLVQALAECTEAQVRVLYRNASKLSTVSRFNVERVRGDVTDADSLAEAMAGCDIVFNLALGRGSRDNIRLVNVEAVRTLVQQAAEAGVQQVVHLSTVSAYGVPPDGELRETSAFHAPKDYEYGFSKWRGEQIGLAVARRLGVSLVVLQPTVVYGPGGPSWTLNPIRMLKSGQVVLIDGGKGICNAVYVDDLVMAMLLAGDSRNGIGERFIISGPSPVTWRAFYGAYETMLGRQSTVSLTIDELNRIRRREAKRSGNFAQLASILADHTVYSRLARLPIVTTLKGLIPRSAVLAAKKAIVGDSQSIRSKPGTTAPLPIHIWSPLDAQLQASRARVSIEKAEKLLRYQPAHDFESGMALTAAWARWANLLPVD